jgi:hypothetical protein
LRELEISSLHSNKLPLITPPLIKLGNRFANLLGFWGFGGGAEMKISLPVLKIDQAVKTRINHLCKAIRGDKEVAETSSFRLLHRGNEKLGGAIWHFSLPPAATCPTMTPSCVTHCYAMRFVARFPKVKKLYVQSYHASLRDDFVKRVLTEIRKNSVSILRLHVSALQNHLQKRSKLHNSLSSAQHQQLLP